MQRVARRAYVSGRVQGVWFRAATVERASALGLAGYARNLVDGRVEVLAIGEGGAVDRLIEWLHRGPPAAEVAAVEVEAVDPVPVVAGFSRR
jgi:acylphosphatase